MDCFGFTIGVLREINATPTVRVIIADPGVTRDNDHDTRRGGRRLCRGVRLARQPVLFEVDPDWHRCGGGVPRSPRVASTGRQVGDADGHGDQGHRLHAWLQMKHGRIVVTAAF